MYTKQFEIRWNDLDANQHLGNSKYTEFMSHTRMAFFNAQDLDLNTMNSYGLGPIVLYEHIYYFKEIHLNDTITVSLEVSGMTRDGRFMIIHHNFYNSDGQNLARGEMFFSWLNLKTRKLGTVSEKLLEKMMHFPRSKTFRFLEKEDIKKYHEKPVDLH